MYNSQKQQMDRLPFNKFCSVCGVALLKFVDFTDNTKSLDVCCNCMQLEPTQKEIVNASYIGIGNASPLFLDLDKQQTKQEDKEKENTVMYDSSGKPSSDIIQVAYGYKPKDIKSFMAIHPEIRRQLPKPIIDTTIQEVKPIIQNTNTNNNINSDNKIVIDWSKIIGYEPIKFAITQTLNSNAKKKTHMLIVGAAGTSKTVFLKVLEENLLNQGLNVHYLDATTLSSSGVIDYLFTHDVKYCLLDEIDKLEREHQRTFLNLLESGLLQETKSKKNGTRKKEMKETLFIATGNYIDKIMHPLLTRFMTFKIPEYTKEEFHAIGIKLLHEQYGKTKEIANYIVSNIWNIYTDIRHEKPNLRYARDIANLTDNNKANIDLLLQAQIKYSESYEE